MQGSSQTPRSVSTSFITAERRATKKQKKESNEHKQFLQACTSALMSCSSEGPDDSDAFGTYVGKKLKSVKDESQKKYAETLITQVLQRAAMKTLWPATGLYDQQSYWSTHDGRSGVPSTNPGDTNTASTLPEYFRSFSNI